MEVEELYEILESVCGSPNVRKPDTNLEESGLLDSFALIQLLNELEDRGIVIHPTQVDRKCFSSAQEILKLCKQNCNS